MRNGITDAIAEAMNILSCRASKLSPAELALWMMQKLEDRVVGELVSSKEGLQFNFVSLPDDKGQVEIVTAYYNVNRASWYCKA